MSQEIIHVFSILGIDLVIAIGFISAFRALQGVLVGVNTTEELAQKDNFAFGISFAGGALAMALILSGAISGDAAGDVLNEAINVLIYAAVGLVLLKIGSVINDFLVFSKVSIKDEIKNQNIAVGVVSAANFVALGLILRGAMMWVESETWDGLLLVALAFVAANVLLLAVTRLRGIIYAKRNSGNSLQAAFKDGNVALAIRYAGHLIGSAFAISAAGGIVTYLADDLVGSMSSWLMAGIALTILVYVLTLISRTVVLRGVNVVQEVDEQQNVGVAAVEAALFIANGLILAALLA